MNRKKSVVPYIILITSLVLLILNIITSDLDSDKIGGFYFRMASSVLLIISMFVVICKNKKKQTNA